MIAWLACFVCFLVLPPFGADCGAETAVIDAASFIDRGRADCGIQDAINALPVTGGVVQLPEGRFPLERYLYLKSGTILRGRGRKTVLTVGKPETRRDVTRDVRPGATEIPVKGDLAGLKRGMIIHLWPHRAPTSLGRVLAYRVKQIRGQTVVIEEPVKYTLFLRNRAQISWGMFTTLAAPAKKGQNTIRIEHPELFKAGYAISLSGPGDLWEHHFNVVTAIDGNTCTLERPLTVSAKSESSVYHAHSMITADRQQNIGVQDLDVEGWIGDERPRWDGFKQSGIHLVRSESATITNVHVRYWNGDGISIQQGENTRVENCTVEKCRGHGFHPGSILKNAEFVNLKSIANSHNGFFYCLYNVNVNLRYSLIKDNGLNGVGDLGRIGDHRCTVEGNTIVGNGRAGIEIIGGRISDSVIRNNVVRDNSRVRPGQYPGIALFAPDEDASSYLVEGNTVQSTLDDPTQWVGIEERNGVFPFEHHGKRGFVDSNTIRNNTVTGHKKADIIIVGPKTVCEANGPAKVLRHQ